MNKLSIRIRREEWSDGLALYFVATDQDGHVTHIGKPVDMVMEPIKENESNIPTIRLGRIGSEQFMRDCANELSKQGVCPDVTEKVVGELTATKKHLEDMRSLVFEKGGKV